jgi:CubicO group peptidase (beta-lactamase class C family)
VSYSPLNFMVGHDGVVSTLTDMVQWVRAMESGRGLPAGSLEAAFRSGGTNDGRPTGYGFGWRLNELGGRRVVEHEGCWSGYRNGIVHVPELELSAIVLTNAADGESFWNCDDGLALARELVRRSLGIR